MYAADQAQVGGWQLLAMAAWLQGTVCTLVAAAGVVLTASLTTLYATTAASTMIASLSMLQSVGDLRRFLRKAALAMAKLRSPLAWRASLSGR